jgi:lipoyl(octanoyl) transferase
VLTEYLGTADYASTLQRMQTYTAERAEDAPDLLLICEHQPLYTLGQNGKLQHVLAAGDIAVVPTNRGGQVTYHGPGQLVAYPLIDLRRAGYFVKDYVYRIEEALIRTLMHFGVTGHRVRGAPGIYVRPSDPFSHQRLAEPAAGVDPFAHFAKVAALGIKVSRHCTYHGLALNVAMDLSPFERINPCGYEGLRTTDLRSLGVATTVAEVAPVLAKHLAQRLIP